MARVIGQNKNIFSYVTCKNCRAELEYTRYEVVVEFVTKGGMVYLRQEHITCPQCGQKVTV